jgi:hypothetical protein
MFDVEPQRKEHPAIKGANEEAKDVPGAIGFASTKVDGQRLFKGGGQQAMGAKPRFKNTGGGNVNASSPGTFKVRKRTLKG